jgi:hypothetical protein
LIDLQVLVQNLPASVNFDKISTMAKACGSVMAIKINRYVEPVFRIRRKKTWKKKNADFEV